MILLSFISYFGIGGGLLEFGPFMDHSGEFQSTRAVRSNRGLLKPAERFLPRSRAATYPRVARDLLGRDVSLTFEPLYIDYVLINGRLIL